MMWREWQRRERGEEGKGREKGEDGVRDLREERDGGGVVVM